MKVDITCPDCGREVSAADVNLERMLGRCSDCSILFPIPADIVPPSRPAIASPGPAPSELEPSSFQPGFARPSTVTVEKAAGAYKLQARWWRPTFILLALVAVVWNTSLAAWYVKAFVNIKGGSALFVMLFPLLHVAFGVAVTFYALAGFLNTTTIEISNGRFRLSHGPLPWWGALDIPVEQISQLYVLENIGSKGSRSYELCVENKDSQKIKLLSNFTRDVTQYLEQELESQLGIQDRPVHGEFGS